jgi:hypothetical protein
VPEEDKIKQLLGIIGFAKDVKVNIAGGDIISIPIQIIIVTAIKGLPVDIQVTIREVITK